MTLVLRPSQAHRWSKCAAFPSWERGIPPQPEGDPAREGTCAAWVAEAVLLGDATACSDMVGKTHMNGWLVTPDMADFVQEYVDTIMKRGGVVEAEKTVYLCENPLIKGTLDSSTHMVLNKLLYVDDLKYGYRIVEVFENAQLIIYAAAKYLSLPQDSVNLIQMSVFQPRAFHHDGIYRKWVVSPEELINHAQRLIEAGTKCNEPEPHATPGPWCRDCPVATRCSALAETTYSMVETILSKKQRDMTPDELSKELIFFDEAFDIIKSRKKAVETEAVERAKTNSIPGWQMRSQTGHRKFTVDGSMVQLLTGKNPFEQKLISPAKLEAMGVSKEIMDKISHKPQIGHKLVRVDENDVAAMFSRKTI